jgi:hypothetical protein
MQIKNLCPINTIKNNSFKQTSQYISQQNCSDVFTRKTSFRAKEKPLNDGKSYDDFINWANKTDFINRTDEILSTGAILGSGFEGKTLSIPDCDNWVIKMFNRSHIINEKLKQPQITEIKDILPELNAGQFIASVKIPLGENYCQHFYVLKKQDGASYGVPYDLRNTVCASTVEKHLEALSQMANMPMETYEKLVDDIQYVTEKGYKFDSGNPYNFMLDTEKQRINFVDIADKKKDKDTQFGEVLFALLDGDFSASLRKSSRPDKEKELAHNYSKTICSKFFIAMIRKQYKFDEANNFLKVQNNPAFDAVIGGKTPDEKVDIMIKLGLY